MTRSSESQQSTPASAQALPAARFGIAVSDYHDDITTALLDGCLATLGRHGVIDQNIVTLHAPGAFELPSVAQMLIERHQCNVVICLGCIIKGETRHDEYIGNAVSWGVMHLAITTKVPVIFGVLTTDNLEQAKERAGGSVGNKGNEAAEAAIRMVSLKTP